jgi:putative flippase GtrA
MMRIRSHRHFDTRSFIVFCIIGIFNTLINYFVFFISLVYANFNYLAAGACGFLTGALSGFFLNRQCTFKSDIQLVPGLATYFLIQIFCLLLHTLIQYLSIRLLEASQVFSQLPSIFITLIVNYNLSKRYIFRKADSSSKRNALE